MKVLNLPTEKHPRPYKVGWIRRVTETKITDVYKLVLSIGKYYQDELLCDVIEMEVCHVLLGRLWQFDKNTIHKGQENSYSFSWNEKKIMLLTLQDKPKQAALPTNTQPIFTTISELKIIKYLKHCKACYLIVDKPITHNEYQPPLALASLLEEFSDLAPPELPSELPTMRDIQDQIDFIPSALPNLPHCRMSPREHTILQEMVNDLPKKNASGEPQPFYSAKR